MNRIRSFISNKHFFTFMMSVFLLISIVLSFFINQNYLNMNKQRKQLEDISNDIEYYDLCLTNDSIIFVLTGNRTYYNDYVQTTNELISNIKIAQNDFPQLRIILQEILIIHNTLSVFEIEAMDTQNSEIFSELEYIQQKENFQQKSVTLQENIKQLINSNQKSFVSTLVLSLIFGGTFIFLLMIVMLYLAHRVQKRYNYYLHLQECTDSLIGVHEDFSEQDLSCLYPMMKNEFNADYVGVANVSENEREFWGEGSIEDGSVMSHDLITLLESSNYPKNVFVIDQHSIYPSFRLWLNKYHCKSCWIVRSINEKRNVVLYVAFKSKSKKLDLSTEIFLKELSNLLLLTFIRMKHEEELFTLATTDALTNINNRRMFKERLQKEKKRHKRFSLSSCLMVMDLDYFKEVNDTYGHDIGDMVLQHFVNCIQTCVRDIDIIGRIGGEEFAIFLPSTTIKQAYSIAQRLLEHVSETPFVYQNIRITYTVSIGLTSIINQSTPIEEDLKRADHAMYKAKSHGRNRIEII